MPLVSHIALPTFDLLRRQGEEVLEQGRALHQDIRELHIGFLNLMPNAAFRATERQFLRLVGSSNQIMQYYVYPFSIEGVDRDSETQAYIDAYYSDFETIKQQGLDALIITGTNPGNQSLEEEAFWPPLQEVVDWAYANVTSTLFSCLAFHAIAKHQHDIERQALSHKRWGIYSHKITDAEHPLLRNINTRFDVPHSRNNDISRAQLEAAGFKVLVYGDEGGVHMAVSPDMFRQVYLQGHPEYDRISLLKEYKREVSRFFEGSRKAYPPDPENYFSPGVKEIVSHYRDKVEEAKSRGVEMPEFPENEIIPALDNTWKDTGKSIIDNWLGQVYQLTNVDRHLPFDEGIDPDDPFNIRKLNPST